MTQPFHPWHELATLAGVRVVVEELDEAWGYYDRATMTIHIDSRLTQAEKRCTLAHELVHLERGDVGDAPTDWFHDKQERSATQEAARRLVPLSRLGDALAWTTCEWEIADALWVDVDTLRARIEHLHPSERAYLRRRMAEKERSA